LREYEEKDNPYFGSIIGRYGNRIENATFKLDGKEYHVPKNNGNTCLHGGLKGFDKHVWTEPVVEQTDSSVSVELIHLSADGDQGFPGNLKSKVKYTFNDKNELIIELRGEVDQNTVVNLTNHAYWNLAGTGTILNHELTINADHYLPVNSELIPTGDIATVKDTPFDFNTPHTIGERITLVQGYDHCFEVNKSGDDKALKLVSRVVDPSSGRQMEVRSSQPCVQLYTGNFLNNLKGSKGAVYNKHDGFCLECQGYNNALNIPAFGTYHLLHPGHVYSHTIAHTFSVK